MNVVEVRPYDDALHLTVRRTCSVTGCAEAPAFSLLCRNSQGKHSSRAVCKAHEHHYSRGLSNGLNTEWLKAWGMNGSAPRMPAAQGEDE